MTYIFPLNFTTQSIRFALNTPVASVPTAATITVLTASFASSVVTSPAAGTNGSNISQATCDASASANPSLLITGPKGATGGTGSKGINITTCPAGTKECPALNVSLSAAYDDGVTRGANYYVPSGSQYSIVCIQIPPTCDAGDVVCPGYLPVGSWPSIQSNP